MQMPANLGAAVPLGGHRPLFCSTCPSWRWLPASLLLVSGYAKTYKEAQMYFFPVFWWDCSRRSRLLFRLSLRSAIILVPSPISRWRPREYSPAPPMADDRFGVG